MIWDSRPNTKKIVGLAALAGITTLIVDQATTWICPEIPTWIRATIDSGTAASAAIVGNYTFKRVKQYLKENAYDVYFALFCGEENDEGYG